MSDTVLADALFCEASYVSSASQSKGGHVVGFELDWSKAQQYGSYQTFIAPSDGVIMTDFSVADKNPGMRRSAMLNGKYIWIGDYVSSIQVSKGDVLKETSDLYVTTFVPYKSVSSSVQY